MIKYYNQLSKTDNVIHELPLNVYDKYKFCHIKYLVTNSRIKIGWKKAHPCTLFWCIGLFSYLGISVYTFISWQLKS